MSSASLPDRFNIDALYKLHKQLFPNVDLAVPVNRFKAEIAYMHHVLLRPPPLDHRFEYCNVLGIVESGVSQF